jgi:hypothetical protein
MRLDSELVTRRGEATGVFKRQNVITSSEILKTIAQQYVRLRSITT